jgi:hypothetical protein
MNELSLMTEHVRPKVTQCEAKDSIITHAPIHNIVPTKRCKEYDYDDDYDDDDDDGSDIIATLCRYATLTAQSIILISELHPTRCHVTSIDCEIRLLVRQDFTVLEPCAQAELGGRL